MPGATVHADEDRWELIFGSSNAAQPLPKGVGNGRLPPMAVEASADLRERLVGEISALESEEALTLWAHRSLPLKNTLTAIDAQAIEAAYVAQLAYAPRGCRLHSQAKPLATRGNRESGGLAPC